MPSMCFSDRSKNMDAEKNGNTSACPIAYHRLCQCHEKPFYWLKEREREREENEHVIKQLNVILSSSHSPQFLLIMSTLLQIAMARMFLFSALEAAKFLPMINLPASDVIIDIGKAIALKRIGIYSSNVKEEMAHSFIPLGDLCAISPTTDVCRFVPSTAGADILELAQILSPRETITPLPRYTSGQLSNYFRNDISRIFESYRPDTFVTEANSIVHFVADHFHSTNFTRSALTDSDVSLIRNNQSDVQRIAHGSSTIISRQIHDKKIGFDFLTDAELMSFFSIIFAEIDKSYEVTDLSESLEIFTEIVVAQCVKIVHSCFIHREHISTVRACLVISTLFLRPSIMSDTALPVYRVIPLPAVVHEHQFMYSNLPELIAINSDDQTVMMWNKRPNRNECLFSIFVHCRSTPLLIPLSQSPCLSDLLNYDTGIAASCQIMRSNVLQKNIANIDRDVWLLSPDEGPLTCDVLRRSDQVHNRISINESSVTRIPCGYAITCANVHIPTPHCLKHTVLIKSQASGKYQHLSTAPWSVKDMVKEVQLTYALNLKNIFTDMMHITKNNTMTAARIFRDFSAMIFSTISLALFSLIILFMACIRRAVQNRFDTLETEVDDLMHEIV
jgi:hypothetical protein